MSLSVDIKKRLGSFQLDVSFEAQDATETLALLGASGCGKSMALKCIAGIERPDEGRIVLNDRVLFDSAAHVDMPVQQRRVGYLFQNYALFPTMTVLDNVLVGVREGSRDERRERALAQIRTFRLEGLEDHRPAELSGGQQQRCALARIMANDPELLLLDEPFSALDGFLRWQLELELSDTLKAFPGGVVFVTHSRDEVYRMCARSCPRAVRRARVAVRGRHQRLQERERRRARRPPDARLHRLGRAPCLRHERRGLRPRGPSRALPAHRRGRRPARGHDRRRRDRLWLRRR